MNKEEKIILGIDPGTNLMGYGVISVKGQNVRLVCMGIIDLKKMGDHYIKLAIIYRDWETDRKSTRLNSSHRSLSRMPSSA